MQHRERVREKPAQSATRTLHVRLRVKTAFERQFDEYTDTHKSLQPEFAAALEAIRQPALLIFIRSLEEAVYGQDIHRNVPGDGELPPVNPQAVQYAKNPVEQTKRLAVCRGRVHELLGRIPLPGFDELQQSYARQVMNDVFGQLAWQIDKDANRRFRAPENRGFSQGAK